MNSIKVMCTSRVLWFKFASLVLVCLVMGACSSVSKQMSAKDTESERSLEEDYQSVVELIKRIESDEHEDPKQDLMKAASILEQINSDHPYYPGPLLNLGVVSWRLEKLSEAKDYFSQVTRLEKQLAEALEATSKASNGLDEKLAVPKVDQSKVNRILENLPLFKMQAHNYLGMIARTEGAFDEAESAYRSALNIDADFLPALRNLAILLDLYRGDIAQALPLYERYQSLLDEPDAQVKDWVFDIKSRL